MWRCSPEVANDSRTSTDVGRVTIETFTRGRQQWSYFDRCRESHYRDVHPRSPAIVVLQPMSRVSLSRRSPEVASDSRTSTDFANDSTTRCSAQCDKRNVAAQLVWCSVLSAQCSVLRECYRLAFGENRKPVALVALKEKCIYKRMIIFREAKVIEREARTKTDLAQIPKP